MRLIFILLFVIAFNWGTAKRHYWQCLHRCEESSQNVHKSSRDELWFTQYLDHFNSIDDRVWKQRYFVEDEYYKSNGPVFLYIGGEGSTNGLHGGLIADEAEHFGAMLFTLEHRFYGESQPLPDLSDENLKYLSTQQALLDTAYFIEGMNKARNLPNKTKWIVFGCSYSGSLAAWMRAKYPHLVHGAVSISAPLVAKVDFPEYMAAVEEGLKSHSEACLDVISNASVEMNKLVRSSDGRKKLEKLFKLCDLLDTNQTTDKDIISFNEIITQIFALAVQYNTIEYDCKFMTDMKKGAPIYRVAELSNLLLKFGGQKCLDFKFSNKIKDFKNVTRTKLAYFGQRQWLYQMCTELGGFQTTTGAPSLVAERYSVDYYLEMCVDVFGSRFSNLTESGVERMNLIYGGLKLEKVVSNAVFVHGSVDPWLPLGITKSINPRAPAIVVNGSSHCADIDIFRGDESEVSEAVKAKRQIRRLLGQWLKIIVNLTYSGVERMNLIFGGLDLANVVSNVVFVHGSVDPWRKVGITNSSNPKAPTFVVNGSSHCADLGFFQFDENDESEVMKTRRQVRRLLGQWLEE